MLVTLNLNDDIVKQIQELNNKEDFINEAIKKALNYKPKLINISSTPSKWALLAEKVNNDPSHLAGYSIQLKKDMQDFRENCDFKTTE